jgi:hypothetical protein
MFRLEAITEPRYTFIVNGQNYIALTMDALNTFLARMGDTEFLTPVGQARKVWGDRDIYKKDR